MDWRSCKIFKQDIAKFGVLVIFFGIFFVLEMIISSSLVSATWSNNSFNNSLSTEELVFTGNQNITRYLSVPSTINLLTNVFLNISGIRLDAFYTGLNHYFKLDETSGTNAENSHNGLYNATAVGNGIRWSSGILENGLELNGTDTSDQYLEMPNVFLKNYGNFTLSFWMNITDTSPLSMRIFNRNKTEASGITIHYGKNFGGVDVPEIRVNIEKNSTTTAIQSSGLINIADSGARWIHVVVIFNNDTSASSLYINGTLQTTSVNDNTLEPSCDSTKFGRNCASVENHFQGVIDEIGMWNRTLNSTEVDFLYNSGSARDYDEIIVSDYITNPVLEIGNLDGVYEWNSSGTFLTNNRTSNLASVLNSYFSGCSLVEGFCLVPFSFHSDTSGVLQYLDMTFDNIGFLENSQTFNSTTYETKTETFVLNLTYDSSEYDSLNPTANLIYNGTSYSATRSGIGDTITFYKSLTMPDISSQTNKSFYWQVALVNDSGTNYFNSTTQTQTINVASLTLCDDAGGTVVYLNFTFKDEETNTFINVTNDLTDFDYWIGDGSVTSSYLITNSTEHASYAFCFIPADTSIITDLLFKYASTGYPQRTFQYNNQVLSNSTTNQVLYLLGSDDGIYSSFQIVTSEGSPVSGAVVQIERQFSGTWTLVGQENSDSSGLVTFWLNSNYDHRITVSKSGYVTTSVTIRPTQSIYTIILSATGGGYTYNSSIDGVYYTKSPASGILSPGTYDFTFNVSAANGNMENCKLELTNSSGSVLASDTTACTSYGYLSITYTLSAGEDLYGKYYVDMGDGYILLEGDGNWKGLAANVTGKNTLRQFFEFLSDPSNFTENSEEEIRYEYTKFVAFFLILALIVAYANYKTNFDTINPGIFVFGLPFLILFISIAGSLGTSGKGFFFMNNATSWPFFDNYIIAFYSLLLGLGFYFAVSRREG